MTTSEEMGAKWARSKRRKSAEGAE